MDIVAQMGVIIVVQQSINPSHRFARAADQHCDDDSDWLCPVPGGAKPPFDWHTDRMDPCQCETILPLCFRK